MWLLYASKNMYHDGPNLTLRKAREGRRWEGLDGGVRTGETVTMEKPLTPRQDKFARLVGIDRLTLADAYRQSYTAENMTTATLYKRAHEASRKPIVAAAIAAHEAMRESTVEEATSLNVKSLSELYFSIATCDPNELISQRVGACRHCWSQGHGYHWKEAEYLEALAAWERAEAARRKGPAEPMPDPGGGFGYRFTRDPNPKCPRCEGEGVARVVPRDSTKLSKGARHLYRGVEYTKAGPKLRFADQDAALEKIGRMLGAFDDKLRVALDAKVQSYKLRTSDPMEAAASYAEMVAGIDRGVK